MDEEIYMHDIFDVLWRSRLVIIGIVVIAVLAAGIISFAIPEVFRVSGIISLGNFEDPIYVGQDSASAIMRSSEFLLDVTNLLKLNVTPQNFTQFKESIKVDPIKGSDSLLEISIESQNKQEGVRIVNGIIQLFANRSQESYERSMKILSDQLATTQKELVVIERDINESREVLNNIEKGSGASSVENELRVSRMLEYLQGEESRRSTLLDHYQDLQKKLILVRQLEIVQEPREPLSRIWPKRTLLVAIAGMLGLIIAIFTAFLREGFRRRQCSKEKSRTDE